MVGECSSSTSKKAPFDIEEINEILQTILMKQLSMKSTSDAKEPQSGERL